MEVIVLKYVQLVCITLFMSNNVNCAQQMIDYKEMTNLKVAACLAKCLDQKVASVSVNFDFASIWMTIIPLSHPQNFTECYDQCANLSDSLSDVKPEAFNASFGFSLYCRDSKRLLIQVESDSGHVGNEKFIYLVTFQETTNSFADRTVYIVSI